MKKLLLKTAVFSLTFLMLSMSIRYNSVPNVEAQTPQSVGTDRLTTGDGAECTPRAFRDSSGTIWVFYFANPHVTSRVWSPGWSIEFLTSDDEGETWEGPNNVVTWEGYPVGLSILEDHLGRIWVVWDSPKSPGGGDNEIWYSISEDRGSSWTSPTKPYEGYAPWNGYTYPGIVEAFGKIWIFFRHWMGSSREGILYFTSDDGGSTWSSRTVIVDGPESEDQPYAYMDSEGRLWLAWARDYEWAGPRDIWYMTSLDGLVWSDEVQVTSSPYSEDTPSIAEDAQGTMYMFFDRKENEQYDVWFSTSYDKGASWTDPVRITEDPSEDRHPTGASIGRNMWGFWHSDRAGSCDIWYTLVRLLVGTDWTKYSGNPLTSLGQDTLADPWIIFDGSIYRIWLRKWDAEGAGIYYSTSSDGISWATPARTDLEPGAPGSWDESILSPCVVYDGEQYRLWFSGQHHDGISKIGYATSTDGISWTKYANPVLVPGSNGGWDNWLVEQPHVYFDGSQYMMWYIGQAVRDGVQRVGLATSNDGVTWTKYGGNPVLTPSSSGWDSRAVWPGPVIKEGDTYLMLYTGGFYPWQIGLATSPDGITWERYANNPVLTPGPASWDSVHVTDPSVVRVGGEYGMWYVGYSELDGTRAWNIGFAFTGILAPSFEISVDPQSQNVAQGSSATAMVTVSRIGEYDHSVALSAPGQPSGVTIGFSPNSGTPTFTSTMNVQVAWTVLADSYSIVIVGTGSDGRTHSTTYTLEVVPLMREARGIFVRPSSTHLFSGVDMTDIDAVKHRTDIFISELENHNVNVIYAAFKSDGASGPDYVSGTLFYDSKHDLIIDGYFGDLLREGFDPMRYLINQAHTSGIEVHAWVPVFKDEAFIKHHEELGFRGEVRQMAVVVLDHVPFVTVYHSKTSVDPSRKKVIDYETGIVNEIVQKYPVDGINLDYVRYTDQKPDLEGVLSYRWIKNPASVVRFAREVSSQLGTDLILSADVYPTLSAAKEVGQDIVRISEYVSVLMPMAYKAWVSPDQVGDVVEDYRSMSYSEYIMPCTQSFETTTDDAIASVISGRGGGADGFALFCYTTVRDELGGLSVLLPILSTPATVPWK